MKKNIIKDEIPNNWKLCNLSNLISKKGIFVDGDWIESKDQDKNGKVRLIQLADIGDGLFRDRSNRFMNYEKALDLNCTFLNQGDILVARMPEPLGRCCIFPFEGKRSYVTVVDIAIIRVGVNGINNKYLQYLINSPQIRSKMKIYQKGTTRKRISRKNLNNIKFPIAPIEEQARIVQRLEELLSKLDYGLQDAEKAKHKLNIFQQSILKEAFEGKLTHNYEVDFDKTEILNRINKERKFYFQNQVLQWKNDMLAWHDSGQEGSKPNKPRLQEKVTALSAEELSKLKPLPTHWKWIKIGQFAKFSGSGSTPKGGRSTYLDLGIPFIRSQNVYPNQLIDDNISSSN